MADAPSREDLELLYGSRVYREFLAERAEVLRFKWLQSEKVGYDIGFEKALVQWSTLHRSCWIEHRRRESEDHLQN